MGGQAAQHRIARVPARLVIESGEVVEIDQRQSQRPPGGFRGHYHVLGGTLSPIDGVGPEALRITDLEKRVREGEVRELILATNPNAEGDATAHFIADRLRETEVTITRIASGIPLGGDIEYADHVTVGRSLEYRRTLD